MNPMQRRNQNQNPAAHGLKSPPQQSLKRDRSKSSAMVEQEKIKWPRTSIDIPESQQSPPERQRATIDGNGEETFFHSLHEAVENIRPRFNELDAIRKNLESRLGRELDQMDSKFLDELAANDQEEVNTYMERWQCFYSYLAAANQALDNAVNLTDVNFRPDVPPALPPWL